MTQLNPKLNSWQMALRDAVTDPQELLDLLELDHEWLAPAKEAARSFPLKVPRGFIARMKKSDPNDPLLRQVLPLGVELNDSGYEQDPLKESVVNPVPGLLHKYHGRVLLTFTGTCGINCRYCFRRNFPYEKNNPGTEGWKKAWDYIAANPSISEVILSGGDPLIATDTLLKNFLQQLEMIPHLTRLRIHSRMPIVMPERMTQECIDWMSFSRLKMILVTHANHPQEIDDSVMTAMQSLKKTGVTLLNQSVLLKGINDDVETLVCLSEKLFEANILPYYLHTLDKARGTAHFDLNHEVAAELHWKLAQRLPGFLVPKLVCEQPGAPAKVPVFGKNFFTV